MKRTKQTKFSKKRENAGWEHACLGPEDTKAVELQVSSVQSASRILEKWQSNSKDFTVMHV